MHAIQVVQRYALHPGGRPEEPKRLLEPRLLARLQSFSFKKPASAVVAATTGEATTGDVEAPPPPPPPADKAKDDDVAAERACLVCTDPLFTGRVVALPCGHLFHKECILPWLGEHDASCPECRFVITPEMLGGTSRRGGRRG
jgi:hypothetical protein